MENNITNCNKCNLYNNQLPLLDKLKKSEVMWVGLSAKKTLGNDIPLDKNTNSGKIIEQIENRLPELKFYKTNLVKCLPLDENNKLRYPNLLEMEACLENLIKEIEMVNPKVIFLLGKKTYNFVYKYFKQNNINDSILFQVEHPSYIYVYKRKYLEEYINKITTICNKNLLTKK